MNVLRQKKIISKNEQINYFEKNIYPDYENLFPSNILFGYYKEKELVGYGGFVHISWEDKRAEISFLVNTKYTLINEYNVLFDNYLKLIKDIGFKHIGFNKIFTETYSIRNNHIKILEKNEFIKEGQLKNHNIINGNYVDSLFHGIINKL